MFFFVSAHERRPRRLREEICLFVRVYDQTEMTRESLQFSLQSRLRINIEQINGWFNACALHKGALITKYFLCFNIEGLNYHQDPVWKKNLWSTNIELTTKRRCQEEIWGDLWVSHQGNSLNIYVKSVENKYKTHLYSPLCFSNGVLIFQSSVCRRTFGKFNRCCELTELILDNFAQSKYCGSGLCSGNKLCSYYHSFSGKICPSCQSKETRANIEDYFCQRLKTV